MKRNKVKVEVFVPLGSCVCDFAPFMEKVGRATSKFKDLVEVQTRSTTSPEATKYGISEMCVIVEGKIKLSASFEDKELEGAILKNLR